MQEKIKNGTGDTMKAGCVVIQNGMVLLVSDAKHSILTFPKGHLERGETVEVAALRETQEETGYTAKIIQRLPDLVYAHGKTGEAIRVAMFLAEPVELLGKGEEYHEWVDIERARDILYPNLKQYVEDL